ncbi:MAG: acetyl-CoA hydrolase/transferase C-terminal domain-containing protein [Acidimicrobiales bacterium]
METPRPVAAEAVLEHIRPNQDIIVPLANGEPRELLDVIEANADQLEGVRIHQMHPLHDRPYLRGEFGDRLRHVSYFLSPITRRHLANGTVDFVPANFSEVPVIMRSLPDPLVLTAGSLPDHHGHVSFGTNADYVGSMVGRARLFVEVNERMPRTFGRNQVHLTQLLGWSRDDHPLVEVPAAEPGELDRRIGEFVAERIPNGATIQTGIGAIPNAVMENLTDHRNLGVHTELISDGVMTLMHEGVVNGVDKFLNRMKVVGTFALGSAELYDYLHDNASVEMWPVRYVNNPRIIGQEPNFVSINSTLEVDFMGQCASESIGSRMYSGSGGQADFARGAMFSQGGQGFIVLHSTTSDGTMSRIKPQLTPGAAVTTIKNTVDKVVTEFGVAELWGKSLRQRAKALIAVAAPQFREELTVQARALGFI